MRNLVFLTLLLLFAVTANGQIYKWIDGKGNTQYSDQPSAGVSQNEKMVEIQLSSQPVVNEDKDITKGSVEKKQTFREKRAAREEARNKHLAEAKMKKENCFRSQSNLELLENSERLSVPDGNGGIIDVDDYLRQKYIDEALKNIASYCQ